jgi:hypothetical protein
VTQQTVNNKPYNYSPNYSIFPEVIRDTLRIRVFGCYGGSSNYVRWGQ